MFVGETGVERVVAAHRRADEARSQRRRPRAGRHPARDGPEVPEPLVHAVARSVRRRGLVATPRRTSRPASRAAPRRRATRTTRRSTAPTAWTLLEGRRGRRGRRAAAQRHERGAARRVRRRLPARRRPLEQARSAEADIAFRFTLPLEALPSPHRHVRRTCRSPRTGACSPQSEFDANKDEWLPSEADRAYVRSLMQPVNEPGKIANWMAPPKSGHQGPALRLRVRPALRPRGGGRALRAGRGMGEASISSTGT